MSPRPEAFRVAGYGKLDVEFKRTSDCFYAQDGLGERYPAERFFAGKARWLVLVAERAMPGGECPLSQTRYCLSRVERK